MIDTASFRLIVADTSSCIYFLEGSPSDPRHRIVTPIFQAAEAGQCTIALPTVVAVELLTKPLRDGNRYAEGRVRLLLAATRGVRATSVTLPIADQAARLRAKYRLHTPDAIVLGAGVVLAADAVIGNDTRWRAVTEVHYIHIDDVAMP